MHLYLNSILKVKLLQSPVLQCPEVYMCECYPGWALQLFCWNLLNNRHAWTLRSYSKLANEHFIHVCCFNNLCGIQPCMYIHVHCIWTVLFSTGFKSVVCARTSCPYGTISLSLLYRETITLPDRYEVIIVFRTCMWAEWALLLRCMIISSLQAIGWVIYHIWTSFPFLTYAHGYLQVMYSGENTDTCTHMWADGGQLARNIFLAFALFALHTLFSCIQVHVLSICGYGIGMVITKSLNKLSMIKGPTIYLIFISSDSSQPPSLPHLPFTPYPSQSPRTNGCSSHNPDHTPFSTILSHHIKDVQREESHDTLVRIIPITWCWILHTNPLLALYR